jgi:hypothetical protein
MSLRTRFLLVTVVSAAIAIAMAAPAFASTTVDVLSVERIDRSTVQATVSVTCDPLTGDAVNAPLFLTIWQGSSLRPNYREGQGGIGLEGFNGLVCDSTAHTYTVDVTLTSFFTDKRFTPGPAGFEWTTEACSTTGCTITGGPTQGSTRIRP